MAIRGTDLPPPYYAVIGNATATRQALDNTPAGVHAPRRQRNPAPLNATEVPNPNSHDTPDIYGIMFEYTDDRIGFIQKVLAIKFLQTLAVTLFMIIFVVSYEDIHYEIYRVMEYDDHIRNSIIVVASLVLMVTIMLLHVCGDAEYVPLNYIFLVIYPLSFAFFASVVTWGWALTEIFVVWIHFNVVVFVLLLYSIFLFQTKREFKTSIGLFITGGVLIVAYALTMLFTHGASAFTVFYCSLMIFALTAYMLIDIQAMISKTYRIHLYPSNYVMAALMMHIDYRYMIMKLFSKQQTVNDDDDQTFDDAV